MSARGRLLSGLVTIVIASAGFSTIGVVPAAAANSGNVEYVALGDSYAAGQGGGRYLNPCLQTAASYPELLDAEKRIDLQANAACSGAETSEVQDQLAALNRGTRLVTLTVGAANLNLTGLLTVCTETPADCQREINERLVLLPALGKELTNLYADVAAAAPKALIVVTGYPHLFQPANALQAAINTAIDQLNTTIEQAVDDADAADATDDNIIYVDVTEAFGEHGIGGDLPTFINPPGTEDAFHPTAAGYVAYADAISATLPKAWLEKQKKSA
jgi:lysophospholipase L1-like esterase